jgi:hypothetical protein
MGTIFLRGNRYGISYIDPNGKQVRRMISEYKETAQRVLRKIETDIVENRYLDRKKVDSVLFEDFLEEFLTNYVYLENRRPRNREGLIRKIAKSFRGKYLQEIDTRMIRQYLAKKLEESKPFNNIRRSFLRAVNSLGLQGLKFHDLRHVFATNLVHKGVDLYVVQQLLGHSSPKMTQRYAHIRPDHFKTAIEEIDLQNTELGYNLASNSTDLAQLLEAK